MKKLAGYSIIAGLVGLVLGLMYLYVGSWAVVGEVLLLLGGVGAWCAGLVLGTWLWDNVHWSLGVLVLVMVLIVAPALLLPLTGVPWWFAYAGYAVMIAGAVVFVGVGLLVTYAESLIKGEK